MLCFGSFPFTALRPVFRGMAHAQPLCSPGMHPSSLLCRAPSESRVIDTQWRELEAFHPEAKHL